MTEVRYKLYEVGGHVRDQLMGVSSNDIDYSVVVENREDFTFAQQAFSSFVDQLQADENYEVFLVTEDVFTVRAKDVRANEVRDFVMARRESGFAEGTRRPASIELGSLEDDLLRRDFTVNAIARDVETGELVDPLNGAADIERRLLKTPLRPQTSFEDDPLRIIRAFRFAVTKRFDMETELLQAVRNFEVARFRQTVSRERVREELYKMFVHDTIQALTALDTLSKINYSLYKYIFTDMRLNLVPTLKDMK